MRLIECDRCGSRHPLAETATTSRSDPPPLPKVARVALTKDCMTIGISADLCDTCQGELFKFFREKQAYRVVT